MYNASLDERQLMDLPTPQKGEKSCQREDERSTVESMMSLSLARADKVPAANLGDYFDRSYSSSSSEASESGWTEVHDQSESSDTGHSVQTHGTLGSAIVVDATIHAQKISSHSKYAQVPVTPSIQPSQDSLKIERANDRRPPRKKPTSVTIKKKKTIRNDSTCDNISVVKSPVSDRTKKKGKKEEYANAIIPIPNDISRDDVDRAHITTLDGKGQSASISSPKKKKKKSRSRTDNADRNSLKQVGSSDGSHTESSPSKKKKKKKTKSTVEDSATDEVEDFHETSPTTKTSKSTHKKKKKGPLVGCQEQSS
jgi:hypothetical protein